MSFVTEFLIAALSAMTLENVFFTRGLGVSRENLDRSAHRILFFGTVITIVTTVSAAIAVPIYKLALSHKIPELLGAPADPYISSVITLLSICIVFALMYLITGWYFPLFHYKLRSTLGRVFFNSAIFGTILVTFSTNTTFWQAIGFAFGGGVGYTLALLLLCEGERRIMLSNVPRAFRGFPILLLYAGILSLAIYGLVGHQLPT